MQAASLFGARKYCLVLVPAFCCLACSAGDTLNPVEGKVVSKDGPVRGAVVTFHPKGADPITAVRPVGFTKDDGTFTLSTGPKEGAPAGEYVVTFIWPKDVPTKGKKALSTDMTPESRDVFDGAYADPARSTFPVEIKRGPNKLEPFFLK